MSDSNLRIQVKDLNIEKDIDYSQTGIRVEIDNCLVNVLPLSNPDKVA